MEDIGPSESGVTASTMRVEWHRLGNVRFQQGVGERLPFRDHSIDLVITLAVLKHTEDVQQVVSETFRVLKREGDATFEVLDILCRLKVI